MSRFLESIRYEQGEFHNLDLHQNRVNNTIQHFFPGKTPPDLKEYIQNLDLPEEKEERYKFRLLYNQEISFSEFIEYKSKTPIKVKFIHLQGSNPYPYKYSNRQIFQEHLKKSDTQEELIFTLNGMVTDSSYSNLAFYNKEMGWVTPSTFLLNGTARQFWLNTHKLREVDIHFKDVMNFDKVMFLNAMLHWNEVVIHLSSIGPII